MYIWFPQIAIGNEIHSADNIYSQWHVVIKIQKVLLNTLLTNLEHFVPRKFQLLSH